jgi:hypothetical protein
MNQRKYVVTNYSNGTILVLRFVLDLYQHLPMCTLLLSKFTIPEFLPLPTFIPPTKLCLVEDVLELGLPLIHLVTMLVLVLLLLCILDSLKEELLLDVLAAEVLQLELLLPMVVVDKEELVEAVLLATLKRAQVTKSRIKGVTTLLPLSSSVNSLQRTKRWFWESVCTH